MSTNQTATGLQPTPVMGYVFSELVEAKIISMFVLGCTSLVTGIVPMKIIKKWWPNAFSPKPQTEPNSHSHPGDSVTDSLVISLMLCFGGGVILCTTLLHVQPEVRENVQALQANGQLFPEFEYMADLLYCLGLFMIFFVEQLVHDILGWYNRKIEQRSVGGRGETNDAVELDQVTTDAPGEENGQKRYRHKNGDIEKGEEELESGDEGEHTLHGLFAVLALSVHELFEGMTIGLEKRLEDVWLLLISVSSHKFVIAFCIGLELMYSRTRSTMIILYVATFSLVTPVGVVIGISIFNYSLGPMAVIFQGLAAGSLMYVVFFEILGQHKKPGWKHILAIIIGFGSLLLVQYLTPHHHHGGGHGHSHSHSHGPGFDQHDHSEHHHPEMQFEEHTHSHGNDEHGHEHHTHDDHTHDDYTHDHHAHDDHTHDDHAHDHHDHDHHDHDHHGH